MQFNEDTRVKIPTILQMQMFAFYSDPLLPRTVIINPYTYYSSDGLFFRANGGALLDAI